MRSVSRLTGVHRNTATRILLLASKRCEQLMSERIQGFSPSVLEVDEAWAYVGKKDRQLQKGDPEAFGSQWIFIAMCRETKVIPAFALGKRTTEVARQLMDQLQVRISGRPRIVTDALEAYAEAVEGAFGCEADYTMMTKEFGNGTSWIKPVSVQGKIPEREVSTSLIERQNLTLRNFVRRLNRKTLCFSKKLENLRAALAIHFVWYNFGRIHQTLRCTPAMEAGLAGSVWEVGRILPRVE